MAVFQIVVCDIGTCIGPRQDSDPRMPFLDRRLIHWRTGQDLPCLSISAFRSASALGTNSWDLRTLR